MIVLARQLDPARRELIHWTEDNVESVEQRAGEQLGRARFAVYGKSTYPDATFTLRLFLRPAQGYPMNGTKAPYRQLSSACTTAPTVSISRAPSRCPHANADNREKLNLATPLDFVLPTTGWAVIPARRSQSKRGDRGSGVRWQ